MGAATVGVPEERELNPRRRQFKCRLRNWPILAAETLAVLARLKLRSQHLHLYRLRPG